MSIEVMKQALKALETNLLVIEDYGDHEQLNRQHKAITALRAAIEQTQEPVAWVYPEGLEALKSGRPWTAYGSNGYSRIPLYLNGAVARRVEPRESESGAGFESLPASPTWWHEPAQMNYRKWQGLTDEEIVAVYGDDLKYQDGDYRRYARAIEARLREKNS